MRQAWAGSDRRATLPKHWPTIRAFILKRDHHRCQIRDPGCTLLATEVDHIGARTDHRLDNLRAVCASCHAHRSAQQGAAGLAATVARGTRPTEPHPGLV